MNTQKQTYEHSETNKYALRNKQNVHSETSKTYSQKQANVHSETNKNVQSETSK